MSLNRGGQGGPVSTQVDPGRLLDDLSERLDRLILDPNRAVVELYHRASWTTRVELRAKSRKTETRHGTDDGTAVRILGRREGFAAGSGRDTSSLHARALANAKAFGNLGRGDAGSGVDRGRQVDHDGDPGLPVLEELRTWLGEARETLGDKVEQCWIEAALTVESWASTAGLRATRLRRRGWAMARICGEAPLLVAGRRWRRMAVDGWLEQLSDRRGAPADPESACVSVGIDASARLGLAMTRVLHRPGARSGVPVGSGWRLSDSPLEPDALLGGLFDDSGAPTKTAWLANGFTVTGTLSGPGHDRRPAFRDPPRPWPAHLVLEPPRVPEPERCFRVASVVIHPVEGSWIVDMGGEHRTGSRKQVRIRPEELARRCLGGIGESRPTHLGVVTPRLLFDL